MSELQNLHLWPARITFESLKNTVKNVLQSHVLIKKKDIYE